MTETTQDAATIVGRAAQDGGRLFREWFQGLTDVSASGGHAAYVFVMGSLAEVLRVFDYPIVLPEIHALQTAVRRTAHEYLNQAEDYGYSPDICGYVKADFALQLRKGEHPMGRIPPPGLAVLTNACNTYIKWAEIWERMYSMPVFTLDIPGTRRAGGQTWPGDPDFEDDKRYVAAQIDELIHVCEEQTGRRFDLDRLREVLGHTNTMVRGWRRALELNASRPGVFNAVTDGTIYLGVANTFRGTPEGARYFEELAQEMEYKATHGIGTIPEEKHRLVFVGVPCYPIFRRFNELFSEWGGVFVASTYLWFASGGSNLGFEYDLSRPLDSLAEGVLISVRDAMDSMFFQDKALAEMVDRFQIDGVVYHPIKSCRTTSTGMADNRRAFMQATDVPSLFIESDMMDKRVVSEAQMKNRIDAFFEGLNSRRLQRAVG
ncbi:MAG TPA: 2-hydroxyacyl-CoA dehydratase family protein [Anaerolineales bacterium]|nr:2-hydroxyacyl-CoA dehydratase family protein [Anaerolineales bacterium]